MMYIKKKDRLLTCRAIKESDISVNRLFLNVDKGFDLEEFRKARQKHQIIANFPVNKKSKIHSLFNLN